MPDVVINDEKVEAKVGEKLLSAARRQASHIGFVCDGRGLCQTCACRVLSGAENLGEMTEIEQEALTESLKEQGYRLACQTTIKESGPVVVISRAEELRRKATGVVRPPEGTMPTDSASSLIGGVGQLAINYAFSLPYIVSNVIPRFQKMPLKFNKVQTVLNDTGRVAQHVFARGKSKDDNVV